MEKMSRKEESTDGEDRVLWNELRVSLGDFPDGTVVKNLSANAGDTGLIPDPGRSHMLRGN